MKKVTYYYGCNLCKNASSMKSMTLWQDEDELQKNGKLISSEEMEKLLTNYFNEIKKKCQFCNGQGSFNFWDIEVNEHPLFSKNAVFILSFRDHEIRYKLFDLVQIISAVAESYDLTLKNFSRELNYDREISYKISIIIILNLLKDYYSINLRNYNEDELLFSYFNYFLNSNITMDDTDAIYFALSNFHLEQEEEFMQDNIGMEKIFDVGVTKFPAKNIKAYFGKQYKDAYLFIIHRLEKLFLHQGITVDSHKKKEIINELSKIKTSDQIKGYFFRKFKL